MVVYRISKEQYAADLLGEGARLFGGRWNSVGIPCLYTSESRALAVLEFSVHLNVSIVKDKLCITVIEIPDNDIITFANNVLPENWNSYPVTSATQMFGTNLLLNGKTSVLKIPSTVVVKEFNYLLNPRSLKSSLFKILDVEDFIFDSRIQI